MIEDILWAFLKYLLEGVSVSVAAFYLSSKKTSIQETFCIGITAAVVFMLLDMFAPSIGASSRQGAGMGIGLQRVGFEPYANEEEYENDIDDEVPTTTTTTTKRMFHTSEKAPSVKKARRVALTDPIVDADVDVDVDEEFYNYGDEHFANPAFQF